MDSSVGAHAIEKDASVTSEPLPQPLRAEALAHLDPLDRIHLGRMLRAERRFPVFLWANLGVAAALAIYYSGSASWSGARAVLVLLILLAARAHLRQLRSARLLRKLSGMEAAL